MVNLSISPFKWVRALSVANIDSNWSHALIYVFWGAFVFGSKLLIAITQYISAHMLKQSCLCQREELMMWLKRPASRRSNKYINKMPLHIDATECAVCARREQLVADRLWARIRFSSYALNKRPHVCVWWPKHLNTSLCPKYGTKCCVFCV